MEEETQPLLLRHQLLQHLQQRRRKPWLHQQQKLHPQQQVSHIDMSLSHASYSRLISLAASKRPSTAPGAGSAAAKKSSASSAGSGGGASKAAAAVNTNEGDDVDDLAMSPDEAEAALGELGIDGWDSCFQANMASAKWQVILPFCSVSLILEVTFRIIDRIKSMP